MKSVGREKSINICDVGIIIFMIQQDAYIAIPVFEPLDCIRDTLQQMS